MAETIDQSDLIETEFGYKHARRSLVYVKDLKVGQILKKTDLIPNVLEQVYLLNNIKV